MTYKLNKIILREYNIHYRHIRANAIKFSIIITLIIYS